MKPRPTVSGTVSAGLGATEAGADDAGDGDEVATAGVPLGGTAGLDVITRPASVQAATTRVSATRAVMTARDRWMDGDTRTSWKRMRWASGRRPRGARRGRRG